MKHTNLVFVTLVHKGDQRYMKYKPSRGNDRGYPLRRNYAKGRKNVQEG